MPTLRAFVLCAAALAGFSAPAVISAPPYFDGFEDQSFAGWTQNAPAGGSIAATNVGAVWDQTLSLQVKLTPPAARAELSQWFQNPLSSGVSVIFWVYLPPGTGAHLNSGDEVKLIDLRDLSNGTLMYVSLRSGLNKNTDKVLFAAAGWGSSGATVGSVDLSQLTEGTWHYLEFDYTPSDVATLEVDDALAYRDLKTTSGQQMGISQIAVGAAGGSLTGSGQITYYLDGLAVITTMLGTVSTPRHADEFESSGLLLTDTPPGKWAWLANQDAGMSELATREAAHRGDGGVRFVNDGGNATPQVNALYGSTTPTPNLYRRVWWRSGSTGSRALVGILGSTLVSPMAPRITAAMATMAVSGTGDVIVGGLGADGGTTSTTALSVFTPGDNAWHLLELFVRNPSGGGTRVGYFDGYPVGGSDGGWTSSNFADGFALGELPGLPPTGGAATYAGIDDFDDDRTSAEMQPSRLVVQAPPTIPAGNCTPVTVAAMASDGNPKPVPEATLATLKANVGAFFSQSCDTANTMQQITLPAGTASAALFYEAPTTEAGPATLEAQNVDYLRAPAQVTILAAVALPPPIPSAPTVPPSPFGAGAMTISWSASDGATGYDVQVSTSSGAAWTSLGSVSGPSYSYVPDAGHYIYEVRATNAYGASGWSPASAEVFVDNLPPAAPSPLAVSPPVSRGDSITIYWGSFNDPTPSSGFKQFNLTVVDPTGAQTPTALDSQTQVFSNTVEGTYQIQVTAEDLAGNVSIMVEAIAIIDRTAPTAPTGLHATVTGGTVSLTWAPSTDATSITYSVEESAGSGFTQVGTTAATTFQVPATLPLGSYRFRVQARDAAGNLSAYSTELALAIAGPPSALRLSMNPKGRVNQPMDVTVTVIDSLGTAVPSYAGAVSFAPTAGVSLPQAYTFSAADQGIHTFAGGVTATSAGTHTVTASGQLPAGSASTSISFDAVSATAPIIIHDASPLATMNAEYRYNDTGRITVEGVPPFTFAVCPGTVAVPLAVDGATGLVTWTPTVFGGTELCVQATASDGSTDQYRFSVNAVDAAPSVLPVAVASASPQGGLAPLDTVLDGSSSTADAIAHPMSFEWLFGDGAASGISAQASAQHRYPIPGAYLPKLAVRDGFGRLATAKVPVLVVDSSRHLPPIAKIVRVYSGQTVALSCECTPPDAGALVYRWDLGEGSAPVDGPTATKTYSPGRYRVTLVVADRQGYTARDSVEIVVGAEQELPSCQAWVEPATFGVAPFSAVLHASVRAGTSKLRSIAWKVDETRTDQVADLPVQLGAGWHQAIFEVTDETGVVCRDLVTIIGTAAQGVVPPKILSAHSGGARCNTPFSYSPDLRPVATGTLPIQWSLGHAPQGAAVDPDTGELSWTPKSAQRVNFELVASNAGGTDSESFSVNVDCATMDVSLQACGCGASGVSGPLVAAGLIVVAVRWRRRSRRAE